MTKLVLCGSIIWDFIGRRNAKNAPKDLYSTHEFSSPHVYGPTSDIEIDQVVTHCTAAHFIIIDRIRI